MIGSTNHPKNKDPLPSEVIVAEQNSKAAVQTAERVLKGYSEMNLAIRKNATEIVQMKQHIQQLQQENSVLRGRLANRR